MMNSWKHAAELLNAHFHVICHGDIPLKMDWSKEAQGAGDLDTQALGFLDALRRMVESRGMILCSKSRLLADTLLKPRSYVHVQEAPQRLL